MSCGRWTVISTTSRAAAFTCSTAMSRALTRFYRDDGMLSLHPAQDLVPGELVSRVRVYEDIAGRYLPFLDSVDERYRLRDDGRVERGPCARRWQPRRDCRGLAAPGIVAGHRLLGAATP